MKKTVRFILFMYVVFIVTGCSISNPKQQSYFNASVLEVNDNSIMVECTKEFNSGITVGEKVSVATETVVAAAMPEMAIGDSIRVVFNGDVMESFPLQIGTVFSIYLLDETGEVIPNK